MTEPQDKARKARAAEVARAAKVERALVKAYQTAWGNLKAEVEKAAVTLKAAKATSTSAVYRQIEQATGQRLEGLAAAEIRYQVSLTAYRITDAQAEAVAAGLLSADEAITAITGEHARQIPVQALRHIIGYTTDGQPLGLLLAELPADAGQRVRAALIQGVANGHNPRKIARLTRESLGGNMARALTISRTEILRAHRVATLATYRENSDVVTGWQWYAQLDATTCPVCIAMHGSIEPSEDDFDTHPNCRCTAIPVVNETDQLVAPPEVEAGPDWFDRQPASFQQKVLGPGKYQAYRDGTITLPDLVQRTHSERWGGGRRERSLTNTLQHVT